ncbi:MAG: hypothetical protein HY645_09255 [Acidobacteria bacterium]|nr:hypothetical protein [Acidobacteriota bacterium]
MNRRKFLSLVGISTSLAVTYRTASAVDQADQKPQEAAEAPRQEYVPSGPLPMVSSALSVDFF